MCILIARITFRFTKEKILSNRIQPGGKAVLITGCDSGFGNGLAERLDDRGFHVFATCLFPNGPGADHLRNNCSNRMKVLELDVTKDENVERAKDFVKDNLGNCELWSVVNNAGVLKGLSTEVTTMQDFKDSMDVNAFGAVRVTKAFLPFLKKSRGRIVNLTSISGRIGIAYFAPYTMSKFAAKGFSECLRRELYMWGVRVITVEPEGFQTEMTKVEHLTSIVSAIGDDIKCTYGEHFLRDCKIGLLEYSEKCLSPKTSRVLDDLEKAICLEYPDIVYQSCRNSFVENAISLFFMLPIVVQDLTLTFVSLTKLPIPDPYRK